MPRRSPNIGAKVYNRILKEFTKINNQLPEDRRLPLAVRRKIISDSIYPALRGVAPSRLRVRDIRGRIFGIVEQIPPNNECNPLYVPIETLQDIEFFALDELITSVLPTCINIKITAFQYGNTNIFNTRNYSSHRSELSEITNNIREDANNKSGRYVYEGFTRIMPNRPNDGKGENYYIDFILQVEGSEEALEVISEQEPPRTLKTRRASSIRQEITERYAKLRAEKVKRKRLNKKHRETLEKVRNLKQKNKSSRVQARKERYKTEARSESFKAIQRLQRALQKGTIDEPTFNKKVNEIIRASFKKGGKI